LAAAYPQLRHRSRRGLLGLMAGVLACLPNALQGEFVLRAQTIGGVAYLSANDVAKYYGLKLWRSDKQAVLYNQQCRLDMRLQRREARLNGTVVHLAFAPQLVGDKVMIAERDFALQIDPVFRTWGLPNRAVRRIVIDPGHGGKDNGTQGDRFREKDLVLQVARRLERQLKAQGYEVKLTRTTDQFIELGDRPAIARQWKADLFVSIHFNSAASASARGIETYVVTPQKTPSTPKTEVESQAVAGNAYDRFNQRLGYEIQRHLVYQAQAQDRGLKRHRFVVLKEAPCPAVLVELAFLSNDSEERLAGTAEYQEKLARGMANGIAAFAKATHPSRSRK
jgi:N-acetylmuramoyl-L-alanine amidase